MASAAAGGRAGGKDRGRARPAGREGDFDLGHLAVVRLHRPLGPQAVGREDAQRPRPGSGEEPEPAVVSQRDLGHELVTGAQQAGVPGGDRGALAGDPALHHGLVH